MPVSNSVPFAQMARVYNSGTQAIGTGAFTAITFDSERYDGAGMHDTGSNTSRITVPVGGVYHIGGTMSFAANATGIRLTAVRVDGTTFVCVSSRTNDGGSTETIINLSCDYALSAASYVELVAYQTSGGNLNSVNNASYTPEFWVHRIS